MKGNNMDKWVLSPPRQRRVPEQMFIAGIVVEGTEDLKTPTAVLYSTNAALLQQIVREHNELLKLKPPVE